MSDVNCSPYQQGLAAMRKVYAGEIIELPEGTLPFNDVMLRTLFAEVWTRDVLSMRDRRLLLLGVIAARGIADVWRVQARAALRNGELTPDELRETLVMLAPYAGYPCVAQLIVACEEIIGDWQREQAAGEPSLPAPRPASPTAETASAA